MGGKTRNPPALKAILQQPDKMICSLAFAQTTYYINAPFLPWLWPALAILGVALELAAIWAKRRLLLLAGIALVTAGCLPERDITLFTGNLLACAGLWYYLKSA